MYSNCVVRRFPLGNRKALQLPKLTVAVAVIVFWGASGLMATAALIDFETDPGGGLPIDNAALPFASAYNVGGVQVTFGFDTDTNGTVETDALFEMAGNADPNVGFLGSSGFDTADPNFGPQLGNFFLRQPTTGATFGEFVVNFVTPLTVTEASGEIWDIDGLPGVTEQYRVQAFNSGGTLLATIDSPIGVLETPLAPLDGQPWLFSFNGLSDSIARIDISFLGTKPNLIGLAFNNFAFTAVPEPGSATLAAGALCVFLLNWRRQPRPSPMLTNSVADLPCASGFNQI